EPADAARAWSRRGLSRADLPFFAECLSLRADLSGVCASRARGARRGAGRGARGLASGPLPSIPPGRICSAARPDASAPTLAQRATLAAVLIAAVVIGYQTFFLPR